MAMPQQRWPFGWLIVIACLLGGNVFFCYKLLSRLEKAEHRLSAIKTQADAQARLSAVQQREASRQKAVSVVGGSTALPADLLQHFRSLKRPEVGDPVRSAALMDDLMRREPSSRAQEQKHAQWLNGALERLPPDAPQAKGVQASCQGARCMVSALFTDDEAARTWATQYVLTAGGQQLRRSNVIVIPLNGSDQSVGLQLYFY